MQTSAIYDPRASATPSQADAARQRLERLRRIGSRARPDVPITLRRDASLPISAVTESEETPEVVDRDMLFALWVDRQRQKHAEDIKMFERRAAVSGTKPSVEAIQKIVAKEFNLPWAIMYSSARTVPIVRARQVAMYLAKELTGKSLPDIGRRFGGRDHTTILHAVRKIADLIERDVSVAADVSSLKSQIEAKIA